MTKVMTFRRCDKVNLPERQREGGLGYGRQVLPDRSWFYVFSAAGDAEHRPSVRAPENGYAQHSSAAERLPMGERHIDDTVQAWNRRVVNKGKAFAGDGSNPSAAPNKNACTAVGGDATR